MFNIYFWDTVLYHCYIFSWNNNIFIARHVRLIMRHSDAKHLPDLSQGQSLIPSFKNVLCSRPTPKYHQQIMFFIFLMLSATLSALTKFQASSFPGTSLKVFGGWWWVVGGLEGDFSVLLWSKTKVLFFWLGLGPSWTIWMIYVYS